ELEVGGAVAVEIDDGTRLERPALQNDLVALISKPGAHVLHGVHAVGRRGRGGGSGGGAPPGGEREDEGPSQGCYPVPSFRPCVAHVLIHNSPRPGPRRPATGMPRHPSAGRRTERGAPTNAVSHDTRSTTPLRAHAQPFARVGPSRR